jgi:phospholipid/cholesterol/gamma-HCH transport system substrate-binding protein
MQDGPFVTNLDRLPPMPPGRRQLRSITGTCNSPQNLIMLQQTLDSARSVFQSAHKVMADVTS